MEQSKKHIQSNANDGYDSTMLVVINGDSSSAEKLETKLNQDVKEGGSKRSVQVVGRVALRKNRSQ
jgi:SpoU rRNA methylase family enzyme